jgi:hypothetical protein
LSRWRRLSNGAVWSLSHSPLVTSNSCCERRQITGLKWSTWRPSLSQASAGRADRVVSNASTVIRPVSSQIDLISAKAESCACCKHTSYRSPGGWT